MAISKANILEYSLVIIAWIIIPSFYIVEVYIILPALNEKWSFWYTFHFISSLFLLHNVAGNFALGLQGPGNIKGNVLPAPTQNWRFCSFCECFSPPRSWHCETCKTCILKRDHHCHFFGCCVGYFNFRYFYLFVMYVMLSTIYALCVNISFFIRFIDTSNINWFSVLNFLFPFASLILDMKIDNAYFLLLGINFVLLLFTGILFVYHGFSLFTGKTSGESKQTGMERYNLGIKANFTDAFGQRWYLSWISPFVRSPLPGDGASWPVNTEFKEK